MTHPLDRRPTLAPAVRLSHDRVRDRWVLLAPELVVVPDETGLSVLRRIDGRPVRAIVAELSDLYATPEEVVRDDVLHLLDELAARGLLAREDP